MNVVEINHLNFGYSKDKLLYQDFSLSLKVGEVISITGPSGVGKSTLFSLLIGVLKPLSGEIKVGRIAQVFQDPYSSFHPSYAILEQIKDVATFEMEDLALLLKELHLDKNLLEKKPHMLSGGQLQRCSILRALLMKPEVILCDEPTSALDNVTQLDVMRLLVSFLDRVGILLITHDDDLASWASDKTIRLEGNKK